MIGILLSLVLAFGASAEQSQNVAAPAGGPSSSARETAPGTIVDPKTPIITISGICAKNSTDTGGSQLCKTMVTREQFDRLTAALAANGQQVPVNARRQLAQTYADLLAYEQAARSSGLESTPEFKDLMELLRLRTLAEIYRRNLQAKYGSPSREDIDAYYRQNPSNFIEMKLRRILVPRKNPSAQNQDEYEKHALEVMNDLRERAAKGDDVDQLQKEAYTVLALPAPPGTDMGNRRKANLLPEYREEILSLNAGEVSKVEQESFSFVVYKIDRKKLLPEEAVKDEISREISRQRLDSALKEITGGIQLEFSEQYFGPPSISSSAGSQQSSSPMPH